MNRRFLTGVVVVMAAAVVLAFPAVNVSAQARTGSIDWLVADTLLPGSDGITSAAQMPTRFDTTVTLTSPLCTVSTAVDWVVTPGEQRATSRGCSMRFQLPEGSYTVSARIASARIRFERDIVVQNFVIASIGDSNGSGEGNKNDGWANEDCHRSVTAGSAQAAHTIEQEDLRSAVTLIHLACSGATIDKGLLGPYEGIVEGGETHAPQLAALREITAGVEIDAVINSIGINDTGNEGFGALIVNCLNPVGSCNDTAEEGSAANEFNANLPVMESLYRLLNGCLSTALTAPCNFPSGRLPVAAQRVYLTEYPDLSTDENGALCDGPVGMSPTEHEWLQGAGGRLNDSLNVIAARAGYRYVGGISDEFLKHGICAVPVKRFIVTITESQSLQGDENGSFHPNAKGHEVTRKALVPMIKRDLLPGGFPRPSADGAATSAPRTIDETLPSTTTSTTRRGATTTTTRRGATTTTRFGGAVTTTTKAGGPPPAPFATTTTQPRPTRPPSGPTTPTTAPPEGTLATSLRGCARNSDGQLRIIESSTARTCPEGETFVQWSVSAGTPDAGAPRDGRTLPVCVRIDRTIRVAAGGSVSPAPCAAGETTLAWALRGPGPGQTTDRDFAVVCVSSDRMTLRAARVAQAGLAALACPPGTTKYRFYIDGPPPFGER